jgi:hypothetical protein
MTPNHAFCAVTGAGDIIQFGFDSIGVISEIDTSGDSPWVREMS